MKKTVIFLAAAVLALSLTACGRTEDSAAADTPVTDRYQEGYDAGYREGYDAAKKEMESLTDNMDSNAAAEEAIPGDTTVGDTTPGDDLHSAVDDVGSAVGDAVDGVTEESVGFRRMLDNARVHDRDGGLNDGENSRR